MMPVPKVMGSNPISLNVIFLLPSTVSPCKTWEGTLALPFNTQFQGG
jgi:hypothetical protein